MNKLAQQQFPLLDQTSSLRNALLDVLTDADLAYTVGGSNPTLGELLRSQAEYQHAYAESFTTRIFDNDYHAPNAAELEGSVAALRAEFAKLDEAFKNAFAAIPDGEVEGAMIDRGFFELPIGAQFHVYREGLLILYAKVVVYFNVLGKPIPPQVQQWIG